MNINTLDTTLRALTPSERNAKNGRPYDWFAKMPTVKRAGGQYLLMSGAQTLNGQNNLFVKKQTRYQEVPPHVHDWLELNYMYDGVCHQTINGHPLKLGSGQVLLIDTDVPHSTEVLRGDNIMVSILVQKKYLQSRFFSRFSSDNILSHFFINAINENAKHNSYILFRSEDNRRIPFIFKEFLCETYDPSLNSVDILDSLFSLLVAELINVYENDIGRAEMQSENFMLLPVLRYIESNFKTCTLEGTAKFFNMNPNYLTTLMKEKFGLSFKKMVLQQRMMMAAKLLRNTNMNLSEVAHEIGYENLSFFNKKFREHHQCSPKEYRKSEASSNTRKEV